MARNTAGRVGDTHLSGPENVKIKKDKKTLAWQPRKKGSQPVQIRMEKDFLDEISGLSDGCKTFMITEKGLLLHLQTRSTTEFESGSFKLASSMMKGDPIGLNAEYVNVSLRISLSRLVLPMKLWRTCLMVTKKLPQSIPEKQIVNVWQIWLLTAWSNTKKHRVSQADIAVGHFLSEGPIKYGVSHKGGSP
ncbi:hypothetical protein [Falsihalocynthiibacter arcticus]|uniref:Uncharacterized protein n=1 Tax=Falsihalocynthiibacter arcticus TaxID=1579316 RepID=A0A126V000_9RHOB|nr:hypothetical protein [Falsihalocynthiibacter arcticus]AML51633.1 hypothetical protein RC74_10485 [Falsihalocynthiibacter arcticus]